MSTAKKFSLEHSLGIALPETFFAQDNARLDPAPQKEIKLSKKEEFSAKILPFGKQELKEQKQQIQKVSAEEIPKYEVVIKKSSAKEAIEIYTEILNVNLKLEQDDDEHKISNNQFCGTLVNKKHY